MINNMSTWTPWRQATLRSLFVQGLSLAEIGRHLGVTKNAVVSYCQRNDMKRGRQSPLSETVVSHRRLRKAVRRVEELKRMRRAKPAMIIEAEIAAEIAEIDAEIAAIPDDYNGPTSMDRLKALWRQMDAVTRECGR